MKSTADKIEQKVVLNAPISRVWNALTNAAEFSSWFGICLKGDFAVGNAIAGTFEKEINESAIMKHQKSLGLKPSKIRTLERNFLFCTVNRIEPEVRFSFRWIPYGIDADVDPKNESTTLVEFFLEQVPDGTQLTLIESGFDHIPERRRERAFRMNEGGWSVQLKNIKRYVET